MADPKHKGKQSPQRPQERKYGRPAPGPVTRAENLFYCNPTQDPNGAPDLNSPLIQSQSFQIRLPKGTWWIHVAPIWDITMVQSIKKVVE